MQVVLQWDFDRVVVAHGAIVETGGKASLTRAYSRFLGGGLERGDGTPAISSDHPA
jgi:hypothetical protein